MAWETTLNFDGDRERKHPEVRKDHAVQAAEKFIHEVVQNDGQIRRWGYVEEVGNYVRIVIENDGRTIHMHSSTAGSGRSTTHITYYSETDTLLFDFRKARR